VKAKITNKLQDNIKIEELEVINESHMHAGHNGFDGSGESHFRLKIKSAELANIAKVRAHQKIYKTLADEMQIIHALAIEIN
jgi:BolA protein